MAAYGKRAVKLQGVLNAEDNAKPLLA